MAGPTITAKFIADTKGLTSGVDKATNQSSGKLKSFATGAAAAIGGAFAIGAVVDFGKATVEAASSVQEATNKVGVVFGKSGDDVMAWSKTTTEAFGVSQREALTAAGTFGNLAVAVGLPEEQAATMSKSLVELAADMASFNDVPVDQALQALQSGLVGETEPLKKFGVNLNEATLKAKAMSMGLSDGKKPLDAAAKAQASYALIMESTVTAQGDVARSSGSLATEQKKSAAKFDDMKVKIGNVLLPVLATLTTFLVDKLLPAFESIGNWISDNQDLFKALGVGLAAVATVVGVTLIPAFIAWAAAAAGAAVATFAAAAPFLLIGAAVAAVAFVIIKNWDTIVAALKAAFEWIKSAVGTVWEVVKKVWDSIYQAVKGAVDAVWSTVQSVWNQIVSVTTTAFNKVKSIVTGVFDWIKKNWPLLLAILTGPIGLAVLVITRNWDKIKSGFSAVWNFIKSASGKLFDFITLPYRMAWNAINAIWGKIKSSAGSVATFMKGVFSGLASAITAPMRIAWNALASGWNRTVGKVSVKIPDFVPGLGGKGFDVPNLPFLAKGGVLTSPTLFVGGEAGTEIVTPEALMRQIIREEGGGAGHYELNIYPRTADASDIAYGFRRLELLAGL